MIALKTLQKTGSLEDDCTENTAKTGIFEDKRTKLRGQIDRFTRTKAQI